MNPPELQHLLQVLDERRAGLSADDVAWAFNSPQHSGEAARWVEEYLSPVTLLTPEELAFTKKHDVSTGEKQMTCRPVTDQEFEEAIQSLESSTASIEKQCKLLEEQKKVLKDICARSGPQPDSQSSEAQRNARIVCEKGRLELEVSELGGSLQTQLQQTSSQSDAAAAGIQSGVERLLERDDRLLDGLERLLPQLTDSNPDIDRFEELDLLCQALISQSNSEIRSRIDNAFIATTHTNGLQTNGVHAKPNLEEDGQQAASLRIELEELCREIDGLSSMAVENAYRIPITRALQQAVVDVDVEKTLWSEYLATTLQYLIARLETTEDYVRNLHARDGALQTLSKTLEHLQTISESRDKSMEQKSSARSPSKMSQNGLKPLRLVEANLSESQDPTWQLMRHLDIPTRHIADANKLPDTLRQTLLDKHERLAVLVTNSRLSASAQLAQSLNLAEIDVEALLQAVFAQSEFGSAKLLSSTIEEELKHLENSTQELGGMMRNMDIADLSKTVQEKQRVVLSQLRS